MKELIFKEDPSLDEFYTLENLDEVKRDLMLCAKRFIVDEYHEDARVSRVYLAALLKHTPNIFKAESILTKTEVEDMKFFWKNFNK